MHRARSAGADRRAASDSGATPRQSATPVPIESVLEIVRQCRGIKPIAVASGGFRSIILQQLAQINLQGSFDAIVTAEDTEHHKPAPDVFLEAARRLGIPATFFTWQNLVRRYPPPFRWMERYCYGVAAGAFAGNGEAVEVLRSPPRTSLDG